MNKEGISYHDSVYRVDSRIKGDNMSNIWGRYEVHVMGGDPHKRCPFLRNGWELIPQPDS